MAIPQIDLGRAGAESTRTDLTLSRVVRAWRSYDRGTEFGTALVEWLRATQNRHTLRVYSHCVLELFEWFEQKTGNIPTPDLVRRDDAVSYERWLRERLQNLTRHRLEKDPERRLDRAIYDIVMANPGINIEAIRERLGQLPEFVTTVFRDGKPVRMLIVDARCSGGLAGRLADLVRLRTIDRTPTLEQARRGIVAELGGPAWTVPASLFHYRVPEITTPAGEQRARGNTTRLAVLAAFWSYMQKSGENAPGRASPLLQVNIWLPLLKRAREKASSQQAVVRASTTPTAELYERLLAVTFLSTHGDEARAAARAAIHGEPIPPGTGRTRFDALRDRALMLIMLQAGGPRAEEIGKMRRRDLVDGVLHIHGKRDKERSVPVPPAALDALRQLDEKLLKMAEHQHKYARRMRADELLSPTAPLLPAIRYWGHNVKLGVREKGLSRQGISMRLRSLAVVAGIDPDSDDMKRIHPHGVRRLYARMELAAGTPLNVLQANMGHVSGAMTLRYAEEVDPASLRGKAFEAPPAPPAPPALPAAPGRHPEPETDLPETAPAPPEPEEMPEPIEPTVVRVVREDRRAAPEKALGTLAESPEAGTPVRWQRRLGRQLSEEESAALEECAQKSEEGERICCEIYSVDWGEKSGRTRINEPAAEVARLKANVILQGRPELASFSETKRLEQTYCGIESGLVWWAGTGGDLELAMPVPSARQVGECSEDDRGGLCSELTSLWREWMDEPSEVAGGVRGPTAAAAMVLWVAEMLDSAAQVEETVLARGGTWVEHGALWQATALGGTPRYRPARRVFREHAPSMVRSWFERVAWQYRPSRGRFSEGQLGSSQRAQKAITAPIRVPSWYGTPDPIAALPPADRAELLDFISILKGDLALRDTTPRFLRGLSRADVGGALFAMREYDIAHARIGESQKKEPDPAVRHMLVERAREQAEDAASRASGAFIELGVNDFDLVQEVTERARRRKAELDREGLPDFYVRMLAKAFGPAVASDPVVRLAATIKRGQGEDTHPLSSYQDLLRIDWKKQTIEHEEIFKKEYAELTNTHSECVARRVARELWELWKSGGPGAGAFKRRRDLLDLVMSLAAYRVPCPLAQERELRELLGAPGSALPVYEQWRRYRSEEEPGELEAMFPPELSSRQKEQLRHQQISKISEEQEEEFQEAREAELRMAHFGAGDGDYRANPRAACSSYSLRAADLTPAPILVVMCAIRPPIM